MQTNELRFAKRSGDLSARARNNFKWSPLVLLPNLPYLRISVLQKRLETFGGCRSYSQTTAKISGDPEAKNPYSS